MVLSITIDPSAHYGSDSSLSDDYGEDVAPVVQVSLPRGSPDHDERAYREVTRPRDLASRPKTKHAPSPRRTARPSSPYSCSERSEESLAKTRPQTPDWQLRSGNQDQDITIHLDLDSALDISQDLERLSRLNRLGHYNEAEKLFKARLASHLDFFPVVAEYADLLLEQGCFGTLERFVLGRLDDSLVQYSMDEMRLLKLLKSLAMIYSRGALVPALEVTSDTLKVYGRTHSVEAVGGEKIWSDLSPGFQIQLVETCLRIIVYAAAHSNFLQTPSFCYLLGWYFMPVRYDHHRDQQLKTPTYQFIDYEPSGMGPASNENKQREISCRLEPWHGFLISENYLWESHRVLRLILQLHRDHRGQTTAVGDSTDLLYSSKDLCNLSIATGVPEHDEQLLLTELANATLLAEYFDQSPSKKSLISYKQFCEDAHFVATVILTEHPHLVNSRPYLDWTLHKAREKQLIRIQSPFASVDSVLFSKVRFHDMIGITFNGLPASEPRDIQDMSTQNQEKQTEILTAKNCLEVVRATAQEHGSYLMQRLIFQSLLQESRNFNDRLQLIKGLANLNKTILEDATGYLQCLIEESLLLETQDASDAAADMRENLQNRFSRFDAFFPSRLDHTFTPEGYEAPETTFFDIPSLTWLKSNVLYQLMQDLGWNLSAELSSVKLENIGKHLPLRLLNILDSASARTFCAGCLVCTPVASKQLPAKAPPTQIDRSNTSTPGPGFSKSSLPEPAYSARAHEVMPYAEPFGDPNRSRLWPAAPPLAIDSYAQSQGYRSYSDMARLERHIRREQASRAAQYPKLATQEPDTQEKTVRENEELSLRIKLLEAEKRQALERALTAENEARLNREYETMTLRDPKGRTFKFSLYACSSFAGLDIILRQFFQDDAFLSSHMTQGDYEFLDPSGAAFSRLDQTHMILPGWTVTLRFINEDKKPAAQGLIGETPTASILQERTDSLVENDLSWDDWSIRPKKAKKKRGVEPSCLSPDVQSQKSTDLASANPSKEVTETRDAASGSEETRSRTIQRQPTVSEEEPERPEKGDV